MKAKELLILEITSTRFSPAMAAWRSGRGRMGPRGVLHAKAVVTDDEAVFITSANLTEAALDRNIEIGLLLRDHALAASVVNHFRGLIDRGLLRPLPME